MRAALYARVSTTRQEHEAQQRTLEAEVARRGWTLTHRFAEEDSATSGEQNSFNRMMRAARRREFDVLLFWAWDRVTRKGGLAALRIMDELDRAGVAYVSHTEPEASSQTDPALRELMVALRGFLARMEARRLSERMRGWHSQRRNLGLPHGRPKGRKDRKPRTRRWARRPVVLGEE